MQGIQVPFTEAELALVARPARLDEVGWCESLHVRALLDLFISRPEFLVEHLAKADLDPVVTDRRKKICLEIFRYFGTNMGLRFMPVARKAGFAAYWNGQGFNKLDPDSHPFTLNEQLDETPRTIGGFRIKEGPTDSASDDDYATAAVFVSWLDSEEGHQLLDTVQALVDQERLRQREELRRSSGLPRGWKPTPIT